MKPLPLAPLEINHLPRAPVLLLTYVYLCVNMPPRVIESPRGGHMRGGAELRRAAEFLQDLEKNLASPLTGTNPNSSLSLPASKYPQSKNPQETPSAPPLAILQPASLVDLPRGH